MMAAVPLILSLCLAHPVSEPQAKQAPDLSGRWTFDQSRSMEPGPDGRIVLAPMLGEEFVALQTPSALTFRISVQGEMVVAVYDLTGAVSENVSPGDIKVTSRARWEGERLVIDSSSAGEDAGKPITIRTKRVIWIDPSGDLIIERTGTPTSRVTSSRSVYRKVR